MNFDQWTRWYNHQHHKNIAHFYCPPKFLHGLLQSIPSLLSVSPGNYYSFCYYSLIFLKFHININQQYVVFYIYLLSVQVMLLRYIHVVTCIRSLFLFSAKQYSIVKIEYSVQWICVYSTDVFAVSITLTVPECYTVGILQYAFFSCWLLSLSDMHLSFFQVFSWLGRSFLFYH